MFEFLTLWPPGAVIGLVSVVVGCLTAIVWGIAIFWSWVRREEIRANLKRDMLQRGLSVEEIERILRAPDKPEQAVNERDLDANLASLLVQYEVSAPTIEQVVRTFQAADPTAKKAVYDAVEEMLGSGAEEEQLVTAIRMLCTPRRREAVAAMG
jgi:hypothetical protein